jgi:Fe-S oxidoreductase
MFGPALYEAFREIKQTFDPHGIFNPGKIVDAPPIKHNLRFGAGYQTPKPTTWFDYDDYGGMGGAVEMCSGVGACRKKLAGTMCPSYMATRDEAHTTRGRANVLRLAMAGRLNESGLGDEGTFEVLDLCLECRACKAECPVGVDMARFKSEFLADYWSRYGTPLKATALGNVDRISEWGSRFASLANWLNGTSVVKWINELALGIDHRRDLPAYRRDTFARWVARRSPSSGAAQVTLFNDTFTNHYDPEIGIAALEVLERGGCGVNVVRPGCCGRPLISQGLLAQAREHAEKVVKGLYPIASKGEPILFCEPSCLSAVKEDAPSLLRGDLQQRAKEVAKACVLFDEYAAKLDLPLKARSGRILVHGHCHQKSMGMLPATMALLSRIPGAQLVDLDAGCCGMAGSFGYDTRHYDVSMAIANRKLLPAVKAMGEEDVLVAPGTSCRHQVDQRAVHPAVLIRSLL